MAIGLASDFKIYQQEFYGGMTEVLQQNSNAFNGASRNCIRLVPMRHRGEYEKEAFMQEITGLVSHRDLTSVAAVADQKLTQGELVSVKIARKIGPVAEALDAFRKISSDPQEFSFILGQQWGKAISVNYINTALSAVNAATSAVAAMSVDKSAAATPTLTHSHLVSAMSLFGDANNRMSAFVMHSKVYFDLMQQSISDKIFDVANVTIYDGSVASLGKPVIVMDSPSLVIPGATPKYITLGLTQNAVTVGESEQREIMSDIQLGLEQIVMRIQGEYGFTLNLKGYSWDVSGAGANPSDAAIGSGANWLKAVSDNKNLGAARLITL